jgi:hypothetical protein
MATRLATAQRELSHWLRAPDGVRAVLAEQGDLRGDHPAAWIRGDERVEPVGRVEIYANAYFFRIHEALATEFEALARTMGAEGFHDLATAYLWTRPSRKPSLRWAGEALPEFLGAHPNGAPFRRRWPWAADLARLEWALSLAFDAEDRAPLGRDDLAGVAPERWQDLRFALHPSASLLDLAWPVSPLLAADGAMEDGPRATSVLVWRSRGTPRHRELASEEAGLLGALAGGERFGDLCGRIARLGPEDEAAARAAGFLAGWIDAGCLVG